MSATPTGAERARAMLDDFDERIAICVEAGIDKARATEIAACEVAINETLTCVCGAGHRPRLI